MAWSAAMDPDGEQATYELRIDSDGEVLESYGQQIFPGPGATSAAVTAALMPGVTYTYAVRARDPHGALSGWSGRRETFHGGVVGGDSDGERHAGVEHPERGRRSAGRRRRRARRGDVPDLGDVAGRRRCRGARFGRRADDPRRDRTLAVGSEALARRTRRSPTVLDRVTVTGAATCISVAERRNDRCAKALTHLVIHRDCATAGITVAAGGGAKAIVNATLVGNGSGVDATGITDDQEQPGDRERSKPRQRRGDRAIWPAATMICLATPPTTRARGWRRERWVICAAAVTFVDLTGHNLKLSGPPGVDRPGRPGGRGR